MKPQWGTGSPVGTVTSVTSKSRGCFLMAHAMDALPLGCVPKKSGCTPQDDGGAMSIDGATSYLLYYRYRWFFSCLFYIVERPRENCLHGFADPNPQQTNQPTPNKPTNQPPETWVRGRSQRS